ncbi:MAG TPA: 50S ribosomal protein L24 [archaeon]|jgi:large subunit ribosomal protein L24|nr:50S ribosomal protein L24 [archaeon]
MRLITKKARKKRKALYTSPFHEKRKKLIAPLDDPLVNDVGKKRLPVRKGDTVIIKRGQFKGKSGKVEKVDYNRLKVYIKDIKKVNSRGRDILIPFDASNLLITDAVLKDEKRIKQNIKKK